MIEISVNIYKGRLTIGQNNDEILQITNKKERAAYKNINRRFTKLATNFYSNILVFDTEKPYA